MVAADIVNTVADLLTATLYYPCILLAHLQLATLAARRGISR
jgi:hypothetical protein